MKKTTTTTTTALTIWERPSKAARILRAIANQPKAATGTFYASAYGIAPDIKAMTREQAYNFADLATFFQLRARDEKTGVELFADLRRQAAADKIAFDIERIGAEHTAEVAAREHHRTKQHQYEQDAARKTATDEERTRATQRAAEHKAEADKHDRRAEDLYKVISKSTLSDRADLVHDAITAALEQDNTTMSTAAKGVKKGIAALAHPDALNSARTDVKRITDEEATAWLDTYGESGKEHRKNGYITVEHRNSKRYPDGYYMILHRRTIRAAIAYDAFDDNGESIGMNWNGGINAITGQSNREVITELFDRANLTERERGICEKLSDNTAALHGARAVDEYRKETREHGANLYESTRAAQLDKGASHKTAEREAARARAQYIRRRTKAEDEHRRKAMTANAFEREGITSEPNRRKILQRLRDRLEAAQRAPEPKTRAEANEQSRRQWERLQANRYNHITSHGEPHRVDLLKNTARAAASIDTERTIYATDTHGNRRNITPTWTSTNPTEGAHWLTYSEREALTSAADQTSRRTWSNATAKAIAEHQTPSAYAALNAAEAARVFLANMSTAELEEAAQNAIKTARAAQDEPKTTEAPNEPTAAEIAEAIRDERRRIASTAYHAERANPYRKSAARAALVFWDSMTATERAEAAKAEHARTARRTTTRARGIDALHPMTANEYAKTATR